MRVEHLGSRSVRYGVGVFEIGKNEPAAQGFFVHVFVERNGTKPVAIPTHTRAALEILIPPDNSNAL